MKKISKSKGKGEILGTKHAFSIFLRQKDRNKANNADLSELKCSLSFFIVRKKNGILYNIARPDRIVKDDLIMKYSPEVPWSRNKDRSSSPQKQVFFFLNPLNMVDNILTFIGLDDWR